jgi:hypothetical protein
MEQSRLGICLGHSRSEAYASAVHEAFSLRTVFSQATLVYAASLARQSENGIMSETTLKGSCLCGAVKYEATGEPARFYHCHCSRCRKATGTGHATNLFLQPGLLKWMCGEEQVRSFKVPEAKRFTNFFCANCGSRLPTARQGSRAGDDPRRVAGPGSANQATGANLLRVAYPLSCEGDTVPAYSDYPPQ